MTQLTYGQKAVGIRFNPSESKQVSAIKQSLAEVIDEMNNLRNKTQSSEQKRHCSIAITELETAQMRAVKALTWTD